MKDPRKLMAAMEQHVGPQAHLVVGDGEEARARLEASNKAWAERHGPPKGNPIEDDVPHATITAQEY